MRSNFHSFLVLALLSIVVACGGGGGGGGGGSVGAPTDTQASTSLSLAVSGLPAGVDAAITVSGPAAYASNVTQGSTLTGLSPGTYTVTAANVQSGATLLLATPASQQVEVTAGGTASAAVAYAAQVAQAALALTLQSVATGLDFPTFLTAPAGDARLFVVERSGRIRIIVNGNLLPLPFLDLHARTTTDGERGLLSMAFHPQYADNGFFFVYFTDLDGNIAIERYSVSAADPNQADPLSGVPILGIPHPGFNNHNGGLLSFGLDGFLYAGTGDGGGGGDTSGNAQNTNSLLGKLLRIDVAASSLLHGYAIPASNPFLNQAGKRAEIWAYGLRNPWRYAFDAATNLLYIADVGQDVREEIDVAGAGQGANNYGWNIMEGSACYNAASCNEGGLTLPVLDYQHGANDANGCAVTGGYVYRGTALPELAGAYLYSDFCGGWLKSFVYSNGAATAQVDWGIVNVGNITSFGQDGQNELYLLSSGGGVYRIVRK